MDVIGHRGCADQYPENTVRAVRGAARHLPAVEVDVRRCGSGEVVAFHDESVERVTDGTGTVSELTLAELSELDVLGSGEPVPTLGAVLEAVPDGVWVQVELKETGLAADVADLVADADVDARVSSFRPEALAEVADVGWEVPTGYLFEERPGERLRTAVDLGCDAVHPHYDLCLGTDVVEAARAEGLRVVAWKAVRTASEVAALDEVGVDGVTADRWDVAPEYAAGAGDAPEEDGTVAAND